MAGPSWESLSLRRHWRDSRMSALISLLVSRRQEGMRAGNCRQSGHLQGLHAARGATHKPHFRAQSFRDELDERPVRFSLHRRRLEAYLEEAQRVCACEFSLRCLGDDLDSELPAVEMG